jgi:GntR family transcriptional regulator / MocR family aminotransferase
VTDVCPPRLYQSALADFMREGHYARHIRKMKTLYGERRSALVEAIHTEFGSTLPVIGGEAGMHLVVMLPKDSNDQEISRRAAEQNLWLLPLSAAYLERDPPRGLVLGFASTTAAEMPNAVRRLRSVMTP